MRIGLFFDPPRSIDQFLAQLIDAERRGFASAWVAQIFSWDALTLLAIAGREVPRMELGTSVVPTYPRHPSVLAGQALTTQVASGGRLVLGIGLSHQIVVEGMWGYSYDRPARHMREYLDALLPLLRGESVAVEGETLKAMGNITIPDPPSPPPVLLAALAPRMLHLAGAVADGTVTWMTGVKTVESHIVPAITAAATSAGRAAPRVAVGLPVCVTDDPAGAREQAAKTFAVYGHLPSYRAMLDKEGAAGPADVAIAGDEATVTAEVRRLADAGATDFAGAVFGSAEERARTLDVLAGLV
ncbi:MAG: 5,10-methylenetetrahydromethanopterin reductase [Actinomycetota bacterium]